MTSSNSTWQFSGLNPLSHFRYSIIHSLSYSCTQAEGSEAKPNRKGSVSIKSSWLPTGDINSLPLSDRIIPQVTWVNIGSGNGLVLKFVPKYPICNTPALVQIMAWRRPGDKPLSEPMMVSLLMHICVTRPQWVNWTNVDQALDLNELTQLLDTETDLRIYQ